MEAVWDQGGIDLLEKLKERFPDSEEIQQRAGYVVERLSTSWEEMGGLRPRGPLRVSP